MLYIIDFGHGIGSPKKGKNWGDGLNVREGTVNHKVGSILCDLLRSNSIEHKVTSMSGDMPLSTRVEKTNDFIKDREDTLFISIHHNAGGGEGCEVWHWEGSTISPPVATLFSKIISEELGMKNRGKKTGEKFTVLGCKGRSILLEAGFMDNREEAEFMASEIGQKKEAEAIFKAIQEIELNGFPKGRKKRQKKKDE